MADDDKDGAKKGGPLLQIVSTVAVALLVGGSAPWWFSALGHHNAKDTTQPTAAESRPAPMPQAAPQAEAQPASHNEAAVSGDDAPTPSKEFFVGTWRVEQTVPTANGPVNDTNKSTYFDDGRVEGQETMVQGFMARNAQVTGTWEVHKISRSMFELTMQTNMGPFHAKYKILDRNHVQNVDNNYVAERVE